MLLELERKFVEIYFNEDLVKKSEKMPNEIKKSLENGKITDKDWDDNTKLSLLINNCINIENNIIDINIINDKIKKDIKNTNQNIKVYYMDKTIIEDIQILGNIDIDFFYKLKPCPQNIKEENNYIISGDNQNIVTKTGKDEKYVGILCQNHLDELKIYKWRIKILKTKNFRINIGVSPIDFDINNMTILMDGICIAKSHHFGLDLLLTMMGKKLI